ncbi:MAG: hypothetical protein ACE5I1_11640 [bacterium]
MARAMLLHNNLDVQTEPANIITESPQVQNVAAAFDRIREDGEPLAARVSGTISRFHYSDHVFNRKGFNNHFQGAKRLRAGQYFVISGGDEVRRMAHLFFIKMGTRSASGYWRSNVVTRKKAPQDDQIVAVLGADAIYWHCGGMDTCGHILAVPIENMTGKISKIVFYNVENPEQPTRFPFEVIRTTGKAGAVTLTRLPNRHYLMAVWSDSDDLPPRLDFYLSRSTNFFDGFSSEVATWDRSNVQADFTRVQHADFGNFQTVNFIQQSDGKLFLIGLHNTSDAAPVVPGDNWIDLFEVDFSNGLPGAGAALAVPTITKIANKMLVEQGNQYNLDAAGGVYIDPSGELCVYGVYHWKTGGEIKLCEFSPRPASLQTLGQAEAGWIELFEHENFRGRMLRIYQDGKSNYANYDRVYVRGASFDDKVSSVRFQLPAGLRYILYKDSNYRGSKSVLTGDGALQEIADLRQQGFGDKVSSSRFETRDRISRAALI